MRLTFTPTVEQLTEYNEAVAAGVDPEVARTEIWPAPPSFNTVLSLVDQDALSPVLVGWTTCGKCEKYVKHCRCKGGPVEPDYITNWRSKRDVPPARAASTDVPSARAASTDVEPDDRTLSGSSYLDDVVRKPFTEEDDRNENPEAYGEGVGFEVTHG